jgi:ribosome biogenesis GTPase
VPKGGDKGRRRRVELRRNRTGRTRPRDWTRKYHDSAELLEDHDTSESVRPKSELSRKREIDPDIAPDILDGIDGGSSVPDHWRRGVVVSIQGEYVRMDDGDRILLCAVRRKLRTILTQRRSAVVVGDRVWWSPGQGDDEGVIEAVGPRAGQLFRRYRDKAHTVVANVDQVVIVASFDEPSLRPPLIDRYTVAAEMGELASVVCLSKLDLDKENRRRETEDVYRSIGIPTIATSTTTGEGLEELKAALMDRQSVIAGQSGVGKSSLLNALQPGLKLATAKVSTETLKGRHTTVSARLIKLDFGGYVVDTPGVRQFLLWQCPPQELAGYFVEFEQHLADCKYPDCTHIHEDRCAVKSAVEDGKISNQRYESYLSIADDFDE